MSQKSINHKRTPTRDEAQRERKRKCLDDVHREGRYGIKGNGGQETEETAAFQEIAASESSPPSTDQDSLPSDVAKICSDTKKILSELQENEAKEELFLSTIKEKIHAKLEEVLAAARARTAARNAKVHELVSAISASVQRIQELDKERERVIRVISSAWNYLEG